MENSEYRKLLQRFCKDSDAAQEVINRPSIIDWNGGMWACATNAHALILMPCTIVEGVDRVEKYPNVANVIPELPPKRIGKVSAKAIRAALKNKEKHKVYFMKPCDECDGHGNFDYGSHEYDCKECDGSGEVKNGYSHSEYWYAEKMGLGNSFVAAPQVELLAATCELFECDAEIFVNPAPDSNGYGKANLFMVSDCYVLIMPLVCTKNDEFTPIKAEMEVSNV